MTPFVGIGERDAGERRYLTASWRTWRAASGSRSPPAICIPIVEAEVDDASSPRRVRCRGVKSYRASSSAE